MINAERARFKSKHQKEINKILETIEKDINKAISDGAFVCQTSISVDTEQSVRDEIEKLQDPVKAGEGIEISADGTVSLIEDND